VAAWLERVTRFARVITFDKVGTGLSDRSTDIPGLEDRMDDVRAVMDAAGSERAALVGVSEGGPMSILFAATFPERVHSLTLYGASAAVRRTGRSPLASDSRRTGRDAASHPGVLGQRPLPGGHVPAGEVTEENMEDFGAAEMACASRVRWCG